ncbi:hypothetical protein SFRURICE_012204 [Spodoptera frugiperda]|nr:hypothetical protein SFRURICE_012204 [Spodoptera frugiperda]
MAKKGVSVMRPHRTVEVQSIKLQATTNTKTSTTMGYGSKHPILPFYIWKKATKAYPTTPSVRSNYYDSPTPGRYNHSAHYTPTTPSVRSNYYDGPTPERYNHSAYYTPTTPSVRSNYYDGPTPERYNHSAYYTPTTPSVRSNYYDGPTPGKYNHSAYYTRPTTPSVRSNYYDGPTPERYNHSAYYTPTTPSVRSNYYDGPTPGKYNHSAYYTRPTTPSNYYDSPTPGSYNHSAHYTPTTPSVRSNHSANIGTTNGSDYTNYASNLTVNGSSNATFIKPKTPVTYDRSESMAAPSNKTRPTSPIYEEEKYYTGGSKSGAYLIGYAVAESRPAPGGEGAIVDENRNGAELIATINTTSVLATSYNGTHTAAIDKSIAPISLYVEDNSTNAGVVMPIEHTLTFYNGSYAVAKSNSTTDRNNNETSSNVTVDVGEVKNTSTGYCNNCTTIVHDNATEDASEERYMMPIEPPASDFVLNNVTTNNKTVDNWLIEDYGASNWTIDGRFDNDTVPGNKNDTGVDKPRPSDGNTTISAYIDGWNSTLRQEASFKVHAQWLDDRLLCNAFRIAKPHRTTLYVIHKLSFKV